GPEFHTFTWNVPRVPISVPNMGLGGVNAYTSPWSVGSAHRCCATPTLSPVCTTHTPPEESTEIAAGDSAADRKMVHAVPSQCSTTSARPIVPSTHTPSGPVAATAEAPAW